ncbi:hypothetical protein E2P81_ATG06636 [Venturia nashicola]|uniref:Uncharacterized protein n=1 Tax=Venturia nashicola TaxID=86259 RepID=A0A4Z1P5E6_9PEZI|nr:hypothetical protein E6O75_ATG06806 [Venturia nashicola]TLD29983.1 hypothetical protein E2P81_ATG06636 [Venturia nashicola]
MQAEAANLVASGIISSNRRQPSPGHPQSSILWVNVPVPGYARGIAISSLGAACALGFPSGLRLVASSLMSSGLGE